MKYVYICNYYTTTCITVCFLYRCSLLMLWSLWQNHSMLPLSVCHDTNTASSHVSLCVCVVMIPLDLTEKGIFASNFGMLGLGDIVIPGAVMLFCLSAGYNIINMHCMLFFLQVYL